MDLLVERALTLNAAFRKWPRAAIQATLGAAASRQYARGELIPTEDDALKDDEVLVIVAGCLRMERRVGGARACLLDLLGPGRLLRHASSDRALELGIVHVAHWPSTVIHLQFQALRHALASYPALLNELGRILLKQRMELVDGVAGQNRGNAIQRLAAALVRLQDPGNSAAPAPLSQMDLASLVQLSRQTTNEALQRLRDCGIVKVAYGRVRVTDLTALRTIASACEDDEQTLTQQPLLGFSIKGPS